MRISRYPSVFVMQALVNEMRKTIAPKEALVVQIEIRSYETKPRFGLYYPGIAEFNWKYFETWKELTDVCLEIISKKEKKE